MEYEGRLNESAGTSKNRAKSKINVNRKEDYNKIKSLPLKTDILRKTHFDTMVKAGLREDQDEDMNKSKEDLQFDRFVVIGDWF